MIPIIINTILLTGYSILILYYRHLWKAVPVFIRSPDFQPTTTITVIVPARNESLNIRNCIQSILAQSYPQALFEIIVVDDFSEDDTVAIVESFSNQSIKLIKNADSRTPAKTGKKNAIKSGVEFSSGKLIVTTDADCIAGTNWLMTLAAFYETNRSAFIAAPVRMKGKGSALSVFQLLDFISLQGIGAAAVHHRFHQLSNGANLAYERKAFEDVKGFEGIDQIASGDDLLLMHKIAAVAPERIGYCLSPEVIVETKAEKNLHDFYQQRIRWASKARFYPDAKITAVLYWVYTLNISLFILMIAGFFSMMYLKWALILLVIKTASELFFMIPVARFFNQQKLLWLFFPAQPIHILYTVMTGFLGQVSTYQWKGRKTK